MPARASIHARKPDQRAFERVDSRSARHAPGEVPSHFVAKKIRGLVVPGFGDEPLKRRTLAREPPQLDALRSDLVPAGAPCDLAHATRAALRDEEIPARQLL